MKRTLGKKTPNVFGINARIKQSSTLWEQYLESDLKLQQTTAATLSKLDKKLRFLEILEVYVDRLDLSDFKMGSGRLNCRAIARQLLSELHARNANPHLNESEHLKIPSLRTIENAVKEIVGGRGKK